MKRKHLSLLSLVLLVATIIMISSASAETPSQLPVSVPVETLTAVNSINHTEAIGSPTIDILVVYTPAARRRAGGNSAMQNLINTLKNKTNESFANSGVNANVDIVYMAEVNYSEASGLETDLDHLQNEDDVIDEVLDWRDTYNADIVSFIVDSGDVYWGMATTYQWPFFTSQPHNAFNVVQVENALDNYTFIHEFGHNMNASHDPPNCRLEEYGACGYYNGTFNTIMGTTNIAHNRILHWSNPNVTYNGDVTGNSESNNAAILNMMAPIVANYRTNNPSRCFSNGTLFCDVPSNYWAYNHINSLHGRITNGCESSGQPNNNLPFCPEDTLNRAQMAVFLLKHIHGNNINYEPASPYRGYFTDVGPDHPQRLWIEELYELGITVGSTNCPGTGLRFCPDNAVTRGAIATFLMKTERYLGNIPDYTSLPFHNVFDDIGPSDAHAKAIEYMWWRGWTNGMSCSTEAFTFCPDRQVNRATAAVFMAQVFDFISVFTSDTYEFDNTASQATQISNGESQTHGIVPTNDQDWLTFSLDAESGVTVETYGGTDDSQMWLYDSNLNEIEYNDDDGHDRFSRIERRCDVNPLSPGTYYIKIDEYHNDNYIARYGVRFTITSICSPSGDSYESDNSSNEASWIVNGSPQNHSIVPADDQDWVKFSLDAESAITLQTSGSDGDTRMWLYDSALNELDFNDDGNGTGYFSRIDRICGIDALSAGTYYVKVDEFQNDDEIATYNLALTINNTCASPPSGDSYESDNSSNEANWIVNGLPQSHSIVPADDQDWVKFLLDAESAITLQTSGNDGDTRMWLYDSTLNELDFNDDDGNGTGYFSRIDRVCGTNALLAGTYYVKVDEYNNDNEISDYTLTYQITESCSGEPSPQPTLAPQPTLIPQPTLAPQPTPGSSSYNLSLPIITNPERDDSGGGYPAPLQADQ